MEEFFLLEEIENKIIEKLITALPNFDVDSFPIDFKNYNFLNHDGCVLLKFQSGNFSEPETIWKNVQTETFEYKVILGFRYLKKISDSYKKIKEIKALLQGLLIFQHKITLKSERPEGIDSGDFWYSITINLKQEIDDKNKYEGGADALLV